MGTAADYTHLKKGGITVLRFANVRQTVAIAGDRGQAMV
jgi:hypothetical protein